MNTIQLKRCRRVGIDVTKRCNWRCRTCFYRWKNDFNSAFDKPLQTVMDEITRASARGCDHVVLVGWGEPSFWPHLVDMIKNVRTMGMTSSIITNGSVAVSKYEEMYKAGLNHLHVSVHGLGEVLDEIAGVPVAGSRQKELMEFLKANNLPWRMNMTMQKTNYKTMPEIALACLEHGCRHIICLGFLPHYEWNNPEKLREVAVHPGELRPYVEKVADVVENWNGLNNVGFNSHFTIRYHPMCHLDEKYRRYVVNARYVLFDPWEWDYECAGKSENDLWAAALDIGNSVSINDAPCSGCGLRPHCGGWNKVYAAGYAGAALCPVNEEPHKQVAGYYHVQNPANLARGFY